MANFNICLLKPDRYIHSYAFLELGELLLYSLKELGHNAKMTFNLIESREKNIVIGCHLIGPNHMKDFPASTVILNTEQMGSINSEWKQNIINYSRVFDIWDYSNNNIDIFKKLGTENAKLLKIGYQKELNRINFSEKRDIDVLFYGSTNDRRFKIIDGLKAAGLNVHVIFGVYGEERDQLIGRSKVVLNLHFFETQIFEVVRVFYLMSNSVAVVSELNDTTSMDAMYREGICGVPYRALIENCISLVADAVLRHKLELNALKTLSRYPQKYFTQQMLE